MVIEENHLILKRLIFKKQFFAKVDLGFKFSFPETGVWQKYIE